LQLQNAAGMSAAAELRSACNACAVAVGQPRRMETEC
jgi:hypothetical protein